MDTVSHSHQSRRSIKVRLRNLFWRLISVLPDRPYLYLKYATIYGRLPNFRSPLRFSELQQLRKMEDRNKLYPVLVDKAAAKTFIADRVGADHVVPSYWVGTDLAEVDWQEIPLPAVVKPTHASGEGFFLRTPADVDALMRERPEADWLALDHFRFNREWAYKPVPPRIVIEKLLGEPGDLLADYRFHCFDGEVVHIELRVPRAGQMHEAVYTPDWEPTSIHMTCYPVLHEPQPRPANLDTMLQIARKIGTGIPFARVDLYDVDGQVFVGEITLYPSGGFEIFVPDDYDLELARHWPQKAANA